MFEVFYAAFWIGVGVFADHLWKNKKFRDALNEETSDIRSRIKSRL